MPAMPLLHRGLLAGAEAARCLAALQARPGGSLPLAGALDVAALLRALPALRPEVEGRLGAGAQLLASQCWVRRAEPPHHWHQDGALHHDFIAEHRATPLPIWTCWIPLTRCGVDAPGLEWIAASPSRLLAPAGLADAALRAHFPAEAFFHPALDAGDALLFDGGLLHRTHVRPGMCRRRTSIELRFIAAGAPPPALAGETLQLAFA